MGCKVIGPFLLAMSQASLPGLLFLVTCHHVIPNEADSISLYPKSKHCTTEPEKVGDMEWQYYDAFSCVGHLHSRHLHFRGATLVIHKWSAVACSGSCSLRCLGLSLCQAESQPSTSLVLEPRLGFWSSKLLDVRLLESVLRNFHRHGPFFRQAIHRVKYSCGRGRNWHGMILKNILKYFKHGVKFSDFLKLSHQEAFNLIRVRTWADKTKHFAFAAAFSSSKTWEPDSLVEIRHPWVVGSANGGEVESNAGSEDSI